jgi:hypothetical protein
MNAGILQINNKFFNKILNYHQIKYSPVGGVYKFDGFNEYNYLVDINSIFSDNPSGLIIDRTQSIPMPLLMHLDRTWTVPTTYIDFDLCAKQRVCELTENNSHVNLFWSGGIDSTVVLVAFLRHCPNLKKVRVLYSTFSIKENPYFFLLLQEYPDIELIDFGGDVYMEQQFNGVFVTGDGADDLTASLDESFFKTYGYKTIVSSWRDFFFEKISDKKFIECCEQFFSLSGRELNTVLEARWWFYTSCKIHKFPAKSIDNINEDQGIPVGFFNCDNFEHYMYFNMDGILTGPDYKNYKHQLKEYIFGFDNNKEYYKNKTKVSSPQIEWYRRKKILLDDTRHFAVLGDGTRLRTANLPLLNEHDYRSKFGDSLNYLFLSA